MKIRLYIILGVLFLLIFGNLNLGLVLANSGSIGVEQPQPVGSSQQAFQVEGDTDTQWRWGEVVSLDPQNKTLTIKYLSLIHI